MADASPSPGRWAFRPLPPEPRSVVELIRAGTLDAQLAATLWVLIEGRVPIVVAAEGQGAGKSTLLDALLEFLAPGVRAIELAGAAETFDWLPQAAELGWHVGPRCPAPNDAGDRRWQGRRVRPDDTVLLIPELSDHLPSYTWGAEARLAIRAAAIGYGLAATIHADALDEVFDALRRPPVGLDDDELSRLGVVLVLRRVGEDRRRVVAAHYVRPTARDMHGHVQRLGPAVLATWDAPTDTFEHFGWGITPELAVRLGRPGRGPRDRGHRPPTRLLAGPGHCRHDRRGRGPPRHRRVPRRPVPHPPPAPRRTRGHRCRRPRAPSTIAELRTSGWRSRTVKDELRANLLARLASGAPVLPGIVGYDDTVLPAIENAILAGQDIIFLGERGQAKTRMARALVGLLDECDADRRRRRDQRRPVRADLPGARARSSPSDGDDDADRLGRRATAATARSSRRRTSRSPT